MPDPRNDPERLAALYRERFGRVTPSRYGEGAQDPAEPITTDRSDTRERDPFDPWTERLRALDDALRAHAADAVDRRARTRRDRDAADRAGRTRRHLDGA